MGRKDSIRPFDGKKDLLWLWRAAEHFGQWDIEGGTAYVLHQKGAMWVIPEKSFMSIFPDDHGLAAVVLTCPGGIRETITLVDAAFTRSLGRSVHSHHDRDPEDSWARKLLNERWGFEMKDGLFQRDW